MADDIEQRLKETTQACKDAYQHWGADKYDASKREELQEAVHELRKVASRLEIEMAVAERDEKNKQPIPHPSHRAARGKGAEELGPQEADGNNGGDQQSGKSGQGKAGGNRSAGGQRRQRRSSSSSSRQQSSGNGGSSADSGNS
jgi:hypothetical protein